jgi:putative copper resistance protein D
VIELAQLFLRTLTLAGQAIALGGAVVGWLMLRPWSRVDPAMESDVRRLLRLVAAGAVVAAASQLAAAVLTFTQLDADVVAAFMTSWFGRAVLVRAALCGLVLLSVAFVLRRPAANARWAFLTVVAVAAAASLVGTAHAAAREGSRAWLFVAGAAHVVAAGTWIGGLAHLVVLAHARAALAWPEAPLRTFSRLALGCVGLLGAGAVVAATTYVDGAAALVGTSYGGMLVTKGVVTAGLLALGCVSLVTIRRWSATPAPDRLLPVLEVEAVAGVALFALAASLSATPPAVDVVTDRASSAEVAARFTPRLPSLATPTFAELAAASALTDATAPRTAEDRLWSEYNHHVAGLLVLAMGLLAIVERVVGARWARHWPLLLIALAVFIALRSDPDASVADGGILATLADPEVLQHRLLTLVPAVFGIFEWAVRTRRLRGPRWAFVFPALAFVGAVLLLAHTHTTFNVKEAFLMEATHLPLGALGLVLGATRWLELRLPASDRDVAGRVWPFALAGIGLLLVFYRES